MPRCPSLIVFYLLCLARAAFERAALLGSPGDREKGWALLEVAEQTIPTIESDELFQQATAHADKVWILTGAVPVTRENNSQVGV